MDEPAYQAVLEALNSLISEKPKVGDRQAYESAYQSLQTYLEVLNLMLLVRLLQHIMGLLTQTFLQFYNRLDTYVIRRGWIWLLNLQS